MKNDSTVMLYFPVSVHASSLKIIQDPTSQIRGFYFTKSQLQKVENLDYANNYAVYFLFSDLEEPSVYIGQSVNGVTRIKSHLREKEFWKFGILFVTDNNSFDKLSIDFLEYHFIQEFAKTQYNLENRDLRQIEPNLNVFNRSTLRAFALQIEFLLEALGISFQPNEIGATENVEYFNAPHPYKASIYLQDGKFILRKGSVIKQPISTSKTWSDGGRFYDRYMRHFQNFIDSEQAKMISASSAQLLHDIEFTSPSKPAGLCSGQSNNGWKFWIGLEEKRMQANT
ncbi:GIY-YIG nuclease family protein [Fictibacillus sp. 23RED33]|uniref:GIY-YIG nuclease family protein n=1 Tax=Fictibacillus sp. 23RED33 TaxID=2745879 RepID=UPI0018CEC19B|nr:GIY-YIG nuclease family protein [Fictibacillus sp. 23RED33]MBH0175759.1 GIY-YIG nuclease family protein [Fictibacillus sp. 23RED33]